MSDPLSLERIRTLYNDHYLPLPAGWADWLTSYTRALQTVEGWSDAELARPESQRALWTLRDITPAGPSESISVDEVIRDPEFTALLVALRHERWSPEPSRRAEEIQNRYDALRAQLKSRLSGSTPHVRLFRILAALLPADLHCGLSHKSHQDIRGLLVGRARLKHAAAAIMARARLREALGEEADLQEHARRSMFCWWLHENAAVIQEGGAPERQAAKPPESPPPTPLAIWAVDRQHRWPTIIGGGVDTLRMPLRECLDGRRFEDLRGAVEDELGSDVAAPKYLRRLLRVLRRMGLIEEEGDRYVTTTSGEEMLESDPPDPLIEALIIRVAGFAALLRELEGGPKDVEHLIGVLAVFAPGTDGKKFWDRLSSWSQAVRLVEKQPGSLRALTPLGREWAARLPETLPWPEFRAGDDGGEEDDEEPKPGAEDAPAHPDFAAIWAAFQTDEELRGYVFTRAQVRDLHAAWSFHPRKRFAILSGLSGTGKTQLLRHYARLVCQLMELDPERHIAVVPVRPDWRDPTGMLGYFNALHADPTFQVEPALALVLRASRRPGLPYFLVLDEMNLARVERYFAPFLSAMETGDRLQLHAQEEPVNQVPASVPWPDNLRIGGTVNMDETTHPFSDKVLDRAFTLEFWDVHLDDFLAGRPDRQPEDGPVEEALLALQALLLPIRRHVGYRAAGEVLGWARAARASDPEADPAEVLDQALFSKVLPRLRGAESAELTGALEALHTACAARGLTRCAAKLEAMRARLLDTGVTSFWS
jgi:5-methylcytosine-specific restriction protein B